MNSKSHSLFLTVILFLSIWNNAFSQENLPADNRIVSYIVDPGTLDVAFYWKNDSGEIIGSFRDLKAYVESKNSSLVFAINGGMFKSDYSPVGLYIEKQQVLEPLNTGSGSGNFNLKPNGVFYIDTHHHPDICETGKFNGDLPINYATQSGPMLVIDGEIHPAFTKGSPNLNIRNGVGILPGRKIIFAISTEGINFFDFAGFFKNLGCEQALYLDGAISEIYFPERGFNQTGGYFGVLIGVTKPENK